MPHGSHFYEPRTNIVLKGTTSIPPDELIECAEDHFTDPNEITIKLIDQSNGFTYSIEINDVKHAERDAHGAYEVTHQKPGHDDHVTETTPIPPGFAITTVRT